MTKRMRKDVALMVMATLLPAGTALAGTTIVYSNSAGGDSYTNAGGSNQGQAIGATGWYYNNVRNSGYAGVNGTYARSGNGSAYMETGGASSKADVEYLSGGLSISGNFYATTALGRLGDLAGLSYEWLRDSSSTAASHLHAALRLIIDADGNLGTTNDRGYLVFERAYNPGVSAVPTDTWVTEDILSYNSGAGAYLWSTGGLPFTFTYDKTLLKWMQGVTNGTTTVNVDSLILGFGSGVGSGWGTYKGAIDNVTFVFAGTDTVTFNFEVRGGVIPVPAAAGLGVIGLGIVSAIRRKLS